MFVAAELGSLFGRLQTTKTKNVAAQGASTSISLRLVPRRLFVCFKVGALWQVFDCIGDVFPLCSML